MISDYQLRQGSILKEYIQYHDTYVSKYGDLCIVLMQVGMFFELYSVKTKDFHIGPDLSIIADILHIQVTRRDKSIQKISCDNYLMSGFPDHALVKFKNILLTHGYTIILVEQITEAPNVERKVTEICSPGTETDPYNKSDSNFLLSLYIATYPSYKHKLHVVGLSATNVSTGKNYVHNIISKQDDIHLWKDDTYRFIHYYNPSEIIIHSSDDVQLSTKMLSQMFDISELIIHNNINYNSEYHKLSYQNQCFSTYFPNETMLSPVEYLDLERYEEVRISYLYLLQFMHQHKVQLSMNLHKPEMISDTNNLVLSNNCIQQLNVIDNNHNYKGQYDSLLSIINKCKTAIGRRHCKERILYPIINPNQLEKRYNDIHTLQSLQDNKPLYEPLMNYLQDIIDVERLHRKMSTQSLHPHELYSLFISYQSVLQIKNYLQDDSLLDTYHSDLDILSEYVNELTTIFSIDELEKYKLNDIETSLFQPGQYPDIDIISTNIQDYKDKLHNISSYLSIFIDKKQDNLIKISHNEKYGWHLYITENRSKLLKKRMSNLANPMIQIKDEYKNIIYEFHRDELTFKSYSGSNKLLVLPIIRSISNILLQEVHTLSILTQEAYIYNITYLYKTYINTLQKIVQFIGFIDVSSTIAKVSIINNYCQPKIINRSQGDSYLDAKDIRHPIIEKIQDNIEYIPNDISLSKDGILLYGTNACGKSTLMKSVGLSLILAQAGFYVPCSSFEYYPYHHIFTRILNNDNMYKGQSSFAVEMNELRSILKRATKHSLILGDELCSGTEHRSAISIFATGLLQISKMESSFIFTSHLHQLMDLECITKIHNLHIYHLKIHYDTETDTLIYDRKLEPGSGPPVYGLEVCKAMDLGNEFISEAKQILLHLQGQSTDIISTKQSNYNSSIYMDKCEICNKPSEHTHHIHEQHTADENGNINHFHKNSKFNLIPLCESCHHNVHNHKLLIHGYQMTNKGIKLHTEQVPVHNHDNNKKKILSNRYKYYSIL